MRAGRHLGKKVRDFSALPEDVQAFVKQLVPECGGWDPSVIKLS